MEIDQSTLNHLVKVAWNNLEDESKQDGRKAGNITGPCVDREVNVIYGGVDMESLVRDIVEEFIKMTHYPLSVESPYGDIPTSLTP